MNPWSSETVAVQQRALVDRQLTQWKAGTPMPQFAALRDAVAYTNCPGMVLEVGAASGYSMEIIPEEYRTMFTGVDVSAKAIEIATARYPQAVWGCIDMTTAPEVGPSHDIVIDGSCLLHIDDWKAHIGRLCSLSRRWVILHRMPTCTTTHRSQTTGYGQTFPAWKFNAEEVIGEMERNGFEWVKRFHADGDSDTIVFARPRHFVTYSDCHYLSRLKALHRSLTAHAGPFRLHVLAWDDVVADWAFSESAENVRLETAAGFLGKHPELRRENLPGPARTMVEHYWTCGPQIIVDVMKATGEPVTYLDADLFAFGSLEPMFAEIGGAPAGFVGHNFARKADGLPGPTVETHQVFGALNVGACMFSGVRVAERWAELCRGWCSDRVEAVEAVGGPVPIGDRRLRYGDQKYLEWLCEEFPGCHVVKDPAAMAGPWNAHTRELHKRGDVVYFGDRPLGLWHFSALKILPHGNVQISRPEYAITQSQIDAIYAGYIQEITR